MTEGERVRKIRKTKGLTLEKFGEAIGIGKSSVSDIENGRRSLTNQTRMSICREFDVSEEWIRYEKGEMFVKQSLFDLNEFAKRKGATDLDIEIVKLYLELEPDVRRNAIEYFKNRLDVLFAKESTTNPTPPQAEPAASDVMSMLSEMKDALAETRRENAELKKRIAGIEEVDKLNAIAHGLWDSIPYSSGSSDTEANKEVGKQKTAHQHDH